MQTNRRAFSLRIFLPEGTPDGVRTVEKSNWTGRAIVCPRSRFNDAKARPDFDRTGVYVLVGPSEESDLPLVYIGEGDPALPRLKQHYAKKDFWTSLVLFISKDDNLNKAHVQYLESRLCELAREAKRCELENANEPQPPSLSEPDQAEAEGFLDEMLLIYPLLGITVFEKPQAAPTVAKRYYLRAKGNVAEGYEDANGFVVLARSEVVNEVQASVKRAAQVLRMTLQESGVIVRDGEQLRFAQDYTFDSPSIAAGVVLGRSANGRTEWKDAEGRTLKENQSAVDPSDGE